MFTVFILQAIAHKQLELKVLISSRTLVLRRKKEEGRRKKEKYYVV
ncbi:MAG: hypothetical protein F6K15_22825 [Okeania sp. SIO2B3]|nr:hypothetical protein [Okeania sp. SIO2B3]